VDVRLVEQKDVLAGAVVALQHLDMVSLDASRLLHDAVVRAGNLLREEPLPFAVGEPRLVQNLQLGAQVRLELCR
jgi:hypothetical protein